MKSDEIKDLISYAHRCLRDMILLWDEKKLGQIRLKTANIRHIDAERKK
jgi:hypothetical protein|tara:strand:- start:2402 stop:2548 length:147 start_codon:yes stop_codon:yes gene_type:complete